MTYAVTIAGLGATLLIPDKTRAIGSAVVSIALTYPITLVALAKYVKNTVMPNIKCSTPQDIAKALPTLGDALTGCFDTVATLQSFCINTAIALALTTAIAAGLAYAISKTYQAIAP